MPKTGDYTREILLILNNTNTADVPISCKL